MNIKELVKQIAESGSLGDVPMGASGVYVIVNRITCRAYIGQTRNFANRKRSHLSDLRGGKHSNKALQADWNKYGDASFLFCPVSQVELDRLLEEERRLIDECQNPYNIDELVGIDRGRPPKAEGEKLERRAMYLPPTLWEKIDAHGGPAWLRKLIERAKPPK